MTSRLIGRKNKRSSVLTNQRSQLIRDNSRIFASGEINKDGLFEADKAERDLKEGRNQEDKQVER